MTGVKIKTDHEASINDAVESFRHPMSNVCQTDSSDRDMAGITNHTEDSSGERRQNLLSQDVRYGFDSENHPTQGPIILEEPLKRIQLHRRQPPVAPTGADEGPSYGLPDDNPVLTDDTNLKITSVTGGYIETRNTRFAEIKKDDTEYIDISGLSLKIDPKQITVFRQVLQEK